MSGRRRAPALHRALALVCLLAVPAALRAQEVPANAPPPPDAPQAEGAAPGGDPPWLAELSAPRSPFARDRVFRARALRGVRPEVSARLLAAEPGGEIALAALAVPLPGVADRVRVPLFVEIDGASFLEHNQAPVARVEVYAYALAGGTTVAGHLAQAFAVDVAEAGEAIWQSGLKLYGAVDLPPGSYDLRLLVRNFQSGAEGRARLTVTVPDFARAAAFTLPPLFPDPAERDAWIPVRAGLVAEGTDYPLTADGEAVVPAARPVLVAGRDGSALLFGRGLPPGLLAGSLHLLSPEAEARVLAAVPFEVAPAAEGGALSGRVIRFKVPDLPPGTYPLRLELPGLAAGAVRSSPVEVALAQGGPRERALLWTDLRWLIGGERAEIAAAPAVREPTAPPGRRGRSGRAEEPRRNRKLERLAAEYRAVLARLGRVGEVEGQLALLELESRILGDQGEGGGGVALRAAELAVARDIAGRDPEGLLPVLALHDELYRTYRTRRLFSLGSHSRLMVEALAELYAQNGGSAEVAALALASLGGYLQEANLPSGSRRLYLRALSHDPRSRPALLGLATSLEKYGDYGAALQFLERLAQAHPQFAEGQLRLAINLDRTAGSARAREIYSRLAAGAGPSWVRSLAIQELARSLVETGSVEAAAELLEGAVAELPGEHGLVFLLAHLQDRLRRPQQAIKLLAGLEPASGGRDSARRLYDAWPESALAEARRALAAAAEVRRPTLAGLLTGGEAEQGGG